MAGKSRSDVVSEGLGKDEGLDPSRAHATPEERVQYIMEEMSENRWRGYSSTRQAAAMFGVDKRIISSNAAEASRTLAQLHAGTPEQREESRGRLLARLEYWRGLALAAKGCSVCGTTAPDMGALAKLEDIEARVTGAYAPSKVEVRDVTVERKKLTEMTPEERIDLHEKAIAEERARLAESRH